MPISQALYALAVVLWLFELLGAHKVRLAFLLYLSLATRRLTRMADAIRLPDLGYSSLFAVTSISRQEEVPLKWSTKGDRSGTTLVRPPRRRWGRRQ
jgi:hypothetical protein